MVSVAQLEEQWIVVPQVTSSSLVRYPMGRYTVIGSGPDCKSGAFGFCWFKSNSAHCVYVSEWFKVLPC